MRSASARLVVRQLLERGPRSRTAIAQATGLTETAVSRAAQRLIAEGIVVEGKPQSDRGKPGRPSVDLRLGDSCWVAGIGIRGYTQWVELRSLSGELAVSEQFECEDLTDPPAVLRHCCEKLEALMRARRVPRHRVLGLGVLIVGVVDPATGIVLRAENLGWRQVDVRRLLQGLVDYPLTIETMLNGMNLLRRQSAPRTSANNVLLVSVALGIGASLIVDGRISSGAGFAAGQMGHMRCRTSTQVCVCGRSGCLDTVASGRAILRQHNLLHSHQRFPLHALGGRFRKLSVLAQSRPDIAEALSRAGRELGSAVGSAIAVVDPAEIVFNGFVIDDDHYYDAVLDELAWYRTGSSAQRVNCIRWQQDGEGAPSMIAAVTLTDETSSSIRVQTRACEVAVGGWQPP